MNGIDRKRQEHAEVEYVLNELLTGRYSECWRYEVRVSGARWADLAQLLVEEDIGVPLGYRAAEDGVVHCNPSANAHVDAEGLYVLVRKGNVRSNGEVQMLLGRLA